MARLEGVGMTEAVTSTDLKSTIDLVQSIVLLLYGVALIRLRMAL